MVPDLFTPSRSLCGIPQILLPLSFARNLMQLAPRAKGLRVFLFWSVLAPSCPYLFIQSVYTYFVRPVRVQAQFNHVVLLHGSGGYNSPLALAISRSRTAVLRFPASLTWQQA